ncbi:MAG: molybdopterin-dependent oxidoreductase, partial [Deltaproteobacteria bacterium]|nr:molybdopterin-dependent oxidoreductase [Deltaproteobacteria bacterium]
VWHCHQAPFMVRGKLSAHLDLPEEQVLVHPLATGGSFGGKLGFEDIICNTYLARAAGKPVRIKESYTEELMDGQPRHPAVIVLRTGVKKDGTLWAWDGAVYYNGGAYAARTPRNGLNGTFLLAGSYRTPHVRMAGYSVYTNQVPTGFFRAPGEVQTLFAVESHMDMMAQALKMDPMEFRLRNSLRDGDTKPTGEPLRAPKGIEVLERVAKISRWKKSLGVHSQKSGSRVLKGRGLAFGYRHIGTGESSAELFLEPDGSLRLATAVRDVGVGAYTMHRQLAAETLGVTPELVQIDVKGTDTGTYDEGVRGQRGTYVEGQAVVSATRSLMEALRKRAALEWQVREDQVQWEGGRVWLADKKKTSLGLGELARSFNGESVRGYGHCKGSRPEVYVFQALVADVEVDRETGQVRVQKLYFALDSSKVVNPLMHQGQIDGAVIQGIGQSLMEDLAVEDGRVLPLSLGDYKIPNINDVSPLLTSLVDGGGGPGPFETKAVAEAGIGIVAPAIANAVYDATGVRIMGLPITAQKVFKDLGKIKRP